MKLNIPSMQDLLGAGVHFGHQVRRGHPRMKPFIYGVRDGIHIIDLAKSEEYLKKAVEFAYELGKQGKTLLVVGTKKQAKDIILNLAKEVGAFYITERWIGGIITNFNEIRRNIKKLNEIKKEKEQGLLSRYTKKEQLLIDRKMRKFDLDYGGIADMENLPDAVFVVDCAADKIAVKESSERNLTLIGLNDTNSDPSSIDYPIPGNDDGIKAIKIVCEAVIKAYGEGKKEFKVQSEKLEVESKEKEEAEKLTEAVKEEAAILEEVVEKKVLGESERKVT